MSSTGGSTGGGGTAATGGSTGTGGALGTGGMIGSGGALGTGGVTGSGGALGTGGATSSGGTMGSGGAASTGGRGGSTGTGGRGGAMGSGGAASTGGRGGSTGTGGRGGSTGTGGSSNACTPVTPPTGGTQHCSSNMSGNVGGGYSYTIWSSGSGGCITPYGVGAAFKANWNNSGDFLARVGLNLGSNRTFDQFGTLSADYAQAKTGTAGGYSYIGIYGWSVNPLHEYYIIDDWYGSRPSFAGDKVGTITVDGAAYDVLTHTQVNQPAITGGNATFVQFWSLRQTARQCGHISITEHFKEWAKLGLTLGNMVEAKILVEAGGGTGSIDFPTATLTAQ
jgi:endo-1,4-beta-xylanase